MFVKWMAGLLLAGALGLPAWAEVKDAPLPFDEPAAAPQIARKAPAAVPLVAQRPSAVERQVKPVAKSARTVSKKSMAMEPAARKPAVAKKTAKPKKAVAGRKKAARKPRR